MLRMSSIKQHVIFLAKKKHISQEAFLAYKKDRDFGQAIYLASKALEIAPYSPDVLSQLGHFITKQDNYKHY